MEIGIETKSEAVAAAQEAKVEVDIEQPEQDGAGQREPVLERFIGPAAVVVFQFIVQGAWETVATTFQFSLLNGGPSSMVYGGILAAFGGTAISLSLAEMASIDPMVGAQYRWSANFAPSAPRFWGLLQGWLTIGAWIFAAADIPANLANITTGLIIFNKQDYVYHTWHTAMLMWLYILVPLIFNLWFRRVLNSLETIGAITHTVFFVVSIITLTTLARHSTPGYVFGTLVNNISGWTNPVVSWGIGLLTVTFPVVAADGVLHMSAEVKRVRTRAPYSIVASTVVSAITQWAFVICLLFTIGDVEAVTNTPTGLPIIEVYYQATNSAAATNIFVIAIALVIFVALFNTFASVSRLTWAFARDRGLPFSHVFSKIHPKLRMPLNALVLISAISFLLSLIYLGSSTAFNAITSLVAIGLHISYFLPILFIMLRKIRGQPPTPGPFSLGRWGILINLFSLMYLIFVIIWMPFPTTLPVTASNMNYAGPVLLLIIIGALVDWMISGHKRFQVPVAQHLSEI